MGYTCQFLSNATYTAQDVNKAFARLTTQGVSLYDDTGGALLSLNTAVANMVTPGVDLYNVNSCKVEALGNGQYKVNPGTAFMPFGETITIDSNGVIVNAALGTAWNVVMRVASNMAIIRAMVGSTIPTNAIKIAEISTTGVVTDTRTFATTKVAPCTGNIDIVRTETFSFYGSTDNNYDINVGWGGFNYVLIKKSTGSQWLSSSRLIDGVESADIDISEKARVYITKNGSLAHFRTRLASTGGSTYSINLIFV